MSSVNFLQKVLRLKKKEKRGDKQTNKSDEKRTRKKRRRETKEEKKERKSKREKIFCFPVDYICLKFLLTQEKCQ